MRLLLIVVAAIAIGAASWWWLRRRRGGSAGRSSSLREVDPFTLSEPWRRHVQAALSAQRRYRDIAGGVQPGPLRDRLDSIGQQVAHAVHECYAIGKRGDELDDALSKLDVASLDRQLQHATDDITRGSLSAQLAAAGRLRTTRDDADTRLRLQVVRMGELTALAAEVSVGTDNSELLGSGVDDVLVQLEGLRLAIQEVEQPGRPATSP